MTTSILTPDARIRSVVRLGDLGVARENLRHDQPADDEITALAASIRAAGLLLPLTVRPGRGRRERPWMALDGRRRLMALEILREAGEVDDDFPVDVFEEHDPARQAAASVLTNTAAPVHVADVIVAIGRMLKAKLTTDVIAGALGQDEIDVRRLAALSALPDVAIEALRQGLISLRQARLLARLGDPDLQVELAQQALDGHGFQEWRATERLGGGALTPGDRRCTLVDPDRYVEAGGRIEADLFGELPQRLLDPAVLSEVWERRAGEIAARLGLEAVTVRVAADDCGATPEGLEAFHESRGWELDGDARQAWLDAREACYTAAAGLAGVNLATPDGDEALLASLRARIARDAASEPRREISEVLLTPEKGTGFAVTCFGPPEVVVPAQAETETDPDEASGGSALVSPAEPPPPANVVAFPPPEPEGGLAQSRADTEVATQGLARALADHPDAALIALTARLFDSVAIRGRHESLRGALAVRSDQRVRADGRCIDALEGDVRRRLAEHREAFETSGRSPISWVAGLTRDERLEVLALVTALSLDLEDVRTGRMRAPARAEAAEMAALCGADLRRHWTPDAQFLRVHTRAQLTAMLEAMEVDVARVSDLSKHELVDRVAEEAAARAWAPASLVWGGEMGEIPADADAATAAEG